MMGSASTSFERMQAEITRLRQELEQARERVGSQVVLDAFPSHVAILDRSGKVIAVNAAWAQFAREADPRLVKGVCEGANYLAVCRAAAATRDSLAAEALEGILAVLEGRHEKFELDYPCHAPARQRWFWMQVTPLSTGGLLLAHTEITERKQAEEARRQVDAQHSQARKLESLGVLAGGIAHDFNNILAGIRGCGDVLRRDLSPAASAHQYVQEILLATQRGADLTRQILAYAGKGPVHLESVELSRVVEGLRKTLEIAVSRKAVLKCQLNWDLPAIQADPVQISQVVLNLVVNASEALGDGDGVISITTSMLRLDNTVSLDDGFGSSLPPGQYACLEVADTGCGMDGATLSRIFDPFFSTKFAGRGLGLSTVHGIVRNHQGAVLVSSQLGLGSVFRVLLPAEASPLAASGEPAQGGTLRGSGTVLVVDDEELIRKMSKMLFEMEGFQVLTAADGLEAVAQYRQHADQIVCVVLDLNMPKMSGEEALRDLRRINPDVRVVLTSGYTEDHMARRFAGQPIFGFVEKPEPITRMIEKLKRELAGRRTPG